MVGRYQMAPKPAGRNGSSEQFAQARQHLVNHGSQRPVNHAGGEAATLRSINPKH